MKQACFEGKERGDLREGGLGFLEVDTSQTLFLVDANSFINNDVISHNSKCFLKVVNRN